MGMPLELNTMIVTKGREKRVEENLFLLEKSGYRLYPIDIPIEIRKTIESESNGIAIIKKLEWQQSNTTITYQLISLNSSNQQVHPSLPNCKTSCQSIKKDGATRTPSFLCYWAAFCFNFSRNIVKLFEVFTELFSEFLRFLFIGLRVCPCFIRLKDLVGNTSNVKRNI